MRTVWVWGDQLNRDLAHLRGTTPDDTRVLLVLSEAKLRERRWHLQKAHLVVSAMRHFAAELEDVGYQVDLRRATSMREAFTAHLDAHDPSQVRAMEPASRRGGHLLHALAQQHGIEVVDNDHFTCHWRGFAGWAGDRERLRMEDLYRWRRRATGYLMDGDDMPAGGRWNHDHDNRARPDDDLQRALEEQRPPIRSALDDIDRSTLRDGWLPDDLHGAPPDGLWATTRRRALARLRRFTDDVLPRFGDHQDAMVAGERFLHHSLLSHALNLGMLHPTEVLDAAEAAYRDGRAPINAVEGFVRQVLGWREFVWGVHHRQDAGYARRNHLRAQGGVPPAFTDWMHGTFVDAYEWVMVPNVIGMGTFADGGTVSTKPYISGGAYVERMSEGYCTSCRYDPSQRTGEDACPFTTLYWDALDRNRERLAGNHRLNRPLATLDRLGDLDEVRARGREVRRRLADGRL